MKRTLSLILILTMLLSLAACGSKDAAPPDGGSDIWFLRSEYL